MAFKFRIYPDKEQIQQINKTFGSCRYIYNHFLARRKELYETEKKTLNYNACSAGLTELKKKLGWLKEVDSAAVQSSLKDLDTAYQNFFRRVKRGETPGYPKFKSKRNNYKSYKTKYTNGNIQVLETKIKLPKLGFVSAPVSRQIIGRIINAAVSQVASGKYYVSICCTGVEMPQYEPTGNSVGIDLGIKALAITSDGETYGNNKYLNKSMKKLIREQRRLSRKQKDSKNRNKQRVKAARAHEKVTNQRLDNIHKMTTGVLRRNDIICIEDLNIKGMVQNHKLAKAISDASWGGVERQLKYKSVWHNKNLIKIGRYFPSSQLCECGYKNKDVKDLSVRYWVCPECGKEHDRDINAASNILNEGLRLLQTA